MSSIKGLLGEWDHSSANPKTHSSSTLRKLPVSSFSCSNFLQKPTFASVDLCHHYSTVKSSSTQVEDQEPSWFHDHIKLTPTSKWLIRNYRRAHQIWCQLSQTVLLHCLCEPPTFMFFNSTQYSLSLYVKPRNEHCSRLLHPENLKTA